MQTAAATAQRRQLIESRGCDSESFFVHKMYKIDVMQSSSLQIKDLILLKMSDTVQIQFRHIPAHKALVVRIQVIDKDFGKAAREGYKRLNSFVDSHDLRKEFAVDSMCMASSPDPPDKVGPVYYEPGYFLSPSADVTKVEKIIEGTEFLVRDSKAGEWAVCTLKGSYSNIAEAYKKTFQAIPANGKKEDWSVGECHEVYLNDMTKLPEEELLTEIRIPVCDA